MIIEKIEDLIGNTPLYQLDPKTYLKLEMFNPGLSIKDRVAKNIILRAEEKGLLGGNIDTILEYTSGNLGIGLALLSASRKYNTIFIAESSISKEKLKLLKCFGSDVILTNYKEDTNSPFGMKGYAERIHNFISHRAYFVNQFENEWNPDSHYRTTAPEILSDLPEVNRIYIPMGTGGIITGIGKFFKENAPHVEIIGITPDSGILYTSFYGIKEKRPKTETLIEGVGEDCLPKIMDFSVIDRVIEVSDIESISATQDLSTRGIFVGGTSGLAMAGKLKDNKEGINVVICGDSGNRYLSNLYDNYWQIKNNMRPKQSTYKEGLHDILRELNKGYSKYPYLAK